MSEKNENPSTGKKVFVGNVPFLCTNEEFVNCFKEMEGFVSAEIKRKHNSKFSRGFGFVEMDTEENANKLMETNEEITVRGRKLRFSPYEYEEKPKLFHVFVRNVPEESSDDNVQKTMSHFGTVGSVALNRDRDTNQITGSGVVGFVEKESMVQALNDREVEAEGLKLSIYPYRRNNKQKRKVNIKTIREAYQAGFKAGKASGDVDSANN